MPEEDKRVSLGLVGLGKIANDQHLPAIAGNPDFKLIATADPTARVEGVPGYHNMTEMLEAHPEIDAISFCTPPSMRVELATAALEANCHVMLEKPPALSVESAKSLHSNAMKACLSLFASWHSRETRCVDRVRKWLVGKSVRRATIDWREDIRQWHPGQNWILAQTGFGVFDPGINALSILTALVPGKIELRGGRLAIPANRAAPIAARFALNMPGDAEAEVTLDFLNSGEQVWDLTIETDRGRVLLRKGGHELHIDGLPVDSCADEEYPRLYHRFAEMIRGGMSDVDTRPLEIAVEALGKCVRNEVEPFEF